MRSIDFVMYTSKQCNLRCRYCYELPLLSDKRRMSLDSIERLFHNVDAFLRNADEPTAVRFCWHGGEPLLIEPEYYHQIFERQQRAFAGTPHQVSNSVQTNLTLLDDARIDLLRHGFDQVGVSLDLFTGLRVNIAGADQEHRARKNLDRLLALGLDVGGITVMSRRNIDRVDDIYEFYRARNMSFRLLPIEPGLAGESASGLEVSAREILRALCRAADLWLRDAPPLRIEPVHASIGAVLAAAQEQPLEVLPYDLAKWLWVVRVDTSGEVLGYNDGFGAENSSGNIFDTAYENILRSPQHLKKAEAARAQIEKSCGSCPHFLKRCQGFHVVDGAPCNHEQRADGSLDCVVARGLLDHLQRRLTQAGVLDRQGRVVPGYFDPQDTQASLPQPAVA